jgi:hypothetical protein
MKIYLPLGIEGYELCQPLRTSDFEAINILVNGERRSDGWKPIAMQLVQEERGRKYLPSDSPWLGAHALILSDPARVALEPLLRRHGEVLALGHDGPALFAFNPLQVVDALDQKRSSVIRFADGRIMRINRHFFDSDALDDAALFKIPNLRVSPTYVTTEFVDLWRSAKLKGLDFREVWSSDSGA